MALLQHLHQRSVCRHAVAPADPAYDWEVLATPRLEDGGQFFVAEERIRSFEVGPNQQSDIVAIANMMQVSFRSYCMAAVMHVPLPEGQGLQGLFSRVHCALTSIVGLGPLNKPRSEYPRIALCLLLLFSWCRQQQHTFFEPRTRSEFCDAVVFPASAPTVNVRRTQECCYFTTVSPISLYIIGSPAGVLQCQTSQLQMHSM